VTDGRTDGERTDGRVIAACCRALEPAKASTGRANNLVADVAALQQVKIAGDSWILVGQTVPDIVRPVFIK